MGRMGVTVCDDFPQFEEWPDSKVYFLENMSLTSKNVLTERPTDVVITESMEINPNFKTHCEVCKERLVMYFHHEEEKWVFRDCRVLLDTVYHFPYCYEFGFQVYKEQSGSTTRP